jgi:hypothetical protein
MSEWFFDGNNLIQINIFFNGIFECLFWASFSLVPRAFETTDSNPKPGSAFSGSSFMKPSWFNFASGWFSFNQKIGSTLKSIFRFLLTERNEGYGKENDWTCNDR